MIFFKSNFTAQRIKGNIRYKMKSIAYITAATRSKCRAVVADENQSLAVPVSIPKRVKKISKFCKNKINKK